MASSVLLILFRAEAPASFTVSDCFDGLLVNSALKNSAPLGSSLGSRDILVQIRATGELSCVLSIDALCRELFFAATNYELPSSLHADPVREREIVSAALQRTNWKVYGADGAAALLRIKPTTLVSKMKRLNVQKTSAGVDVNGGALRQG